MEQVQMTMLNMMQAMAIPQNSRSTESVKPESDFRSMMEKQSKQPQTEEAVEKVKKEELPKEKLSAEKLPKEELDEAAMQELAAMQMFVADTMQIVTAAEEQVAVGELMSRSSVVNTAEVVVAEQAEMLEPTVESAPVAEVEAMQSEVMPEAKPVEQVQGSGVENDGAEAKQPEESFAEEVEVAVGEQKVFHEVEAAPVKVSEVASEAKTAEAESVSAQISDKLVETLADGETRVELQLNPEHLGKITIELKQSSDGTVHVSLLAEKSETRLVLERGMSGLQSLLHQNVRENVQVEVSHQQEAQQHESYEGHQQQNSREQEQKQERRHDEDFLDQLRLGLIPQEES